MNTSVIGYPRIGKDRELKFASEKFFNGELDEAGLIETAAKIRKDDLLKQKTAGITYISSNDFSFYDNRFEILGDDYMENAKQTKAMLDKAGLLCNQAHAPFDLVEGEPFAVSCLHYKMIVRSIEYAAYLGAKTIVVHLICTANRENLYSYNQKYYKSLAPFGEKFGIKIAVENDFERRNGEILPVLNEPLEFCAFIENLNSEWLVGCVDIGHAAMFQDPVEFISKTNGKVVQALHVHDNDLHEDLHLFPLTGNINWRSLCGVLKNVNYKGDFTFEAIKSFAKIPGDFMEETLVYLAKMGRYFIKQIGE